MQKTLDASLHDRNANKKLNPVESTKKLTDEKILPSVMSITDIVQIIESIEVHADEDDNVKKSQAEEVYKLTEKSLEAIYIIPIRVQQMKDKRSQMGRKDSSETSKD